MIVILTGAKKNVGDYLIGSRARKLLRKFVDDEIVELDRFQRLDSQLEVINKSRMLVLCGGPAYTENIYPGIYPLTNPVSAIKVPIVPFGLGWCGQPANHPERFIFNESSQKFLEAIHSDIRYSSCRDEITLSVLRRHGYQNVMMTGCPVWYDLPSMGKGLQLPTFNRIIYTTPASVRLVRQNSQIMSLLRRSFPKAEIVCSFHRGILPDSHTSIKTSIGYSLMAAEAYRHGLKVVNASYSLEKINFYRDFDFHVGYRVHAHLDFISRRNASILINEDGRGQGMVRALGLTELNSSDPQLIESVENLINKYKEGEFDEVRTSIDVIEKTYSSMKSFLETLR